jgi:hypothetical protein
VTRLPVASTGFTTPEANLGELNIAIKDTVTAASHFVQGLLPYAIPMVPLLIARAQLGSAVESQMNQLALMHAVLSELSQLVFTSFRASQLMVDSTFLNNIADDEDLRLLLLIEQKKAAFWLNSFGDAAASAEKICHTAKPLAAQMITSLFNSKVIQWNANGKSKQCMEQVLPAAVAAVKAAIKAQVIVSSMHSRLLHLCVPGWNNQGAQHSLFGPTAPASWAVAWPLIPPLSSKHMQPGARLWAAGNMSAMLAEAGSAAAVFCQEPAVVQLTERVEQLPDFTESSGFAAAGRGMVQQQQGPFKVLRKARMCVVQVPLR